MPVEGLKVISVNPKHEAYKQVELRATKNAHGKGLSGVMLRDLLRYYMMIERARINLLSLLTDRDFVVLETICVQNRNELSANNFPSLLNDYVILTGEKKDEVQLSEFILIDKTAYSLAIIDAFEFMEIKGYASLKIAMHNLNGTQPKQKVSK